MCCSSAISPIALPEAPRFETPWGKQTQMRTADVERMQQHLTRLKLYADKIDGKAGMQTRAALGAFQKAKGLALDCWPTADVLNALSSRDVSK